MKTLLEIQESMGITPPALAKRPVLRPDCFGYMNTFDTLSDTRDYTEVGGLPLKPSEVAAHLTEMGISGGERRLKFYSMMLELDRVYIRETLKE